MNFNYDNPDFFILYSANWYPLFSSKKIRKPILTLNRCILIKITLYHLIFLSCYLEVNSQGIADAIGARYLALGAYSLQHADVYATRGNPASLAQLKQPAVAVYGENRFLLPELNLFAASIGYTTTSGNFALHGTYFGFNLSNQTKMSLAYGRKMSSKVDAGVSFDLHQLSQGRFYGKATAITGTAGVLLHLTEKIHAGINVFNPIHAAYDKENVERLPSQYNFGIGFDVSDKLYISTELVKAEGHHVSVNAGMQYQFVKSFFIRAGIATLTANYFTGLGFILGDFRLDIATSYHPQLGFSPGLLLLYEFGTKKKEVTE